LWSGQTADGRKHSREGSKVDPTPWDGASDLRVFLVDEAINSKISLLWTAFKEANVTATPTESGDLARSQMVSDFMRWLVKTQIPFLDREVEILCNILQQDGIAATGQFWEEKEEKTLVNVTMETMQRQFPQLDVKELINAPDVADDLYAIWEEIYGCSNKKAKKMLAELRATGTTTVAVVGKRKGYPVVRAFSLSENLFIPASATDIETAPAIYRVEYFSPETMRSMINNAGWDEAWVEAAIQRCRGQLITNIYDQYNQPVARSMVYQEQRYENLIGVVYAYQRLSDEDNVSGIYCTIFNPQLPPDATQDGYAKTGLLGYAHGKYPFSLHRREYLSRKLHDSRGLPEPGKPIQDQVKVHKDSLVDAASISIMPPLLYKSGRAPSRWGAGVRVPVQRMDEIQVMQKMAYDPSTEKSERQLSDDFNRYNGFVSAETDPAFAGMKNKKEVKAFLDCWADAFGQIFSLYTQFGSEQVAFRVTGSKRSDPEMFTKGDLTENFDWRLDFEIQSHDLEQMERKWKAILEGIQLLNREGNVNFARTIQAYISSIDPNIAELILDPTDVGRQKVIDDEQADLTQIFAGVNKNIKLGTPPQLGIEVMKNYLGAPDVQQRYASDPSFKERIDARAKMYLQQINQERNKTIGILGSDTPQPVMQ
jgi:hypothetical protein